MYLSGPFSASGPLPHERGKVLIPFLLRIVRFTEFDWQEALGNGQMPDLKIKITSKDG